MPVASFRVSTPPASPQSQAPPGTPGVDSDVAFTAELIDAIAEVVVLTPDAARRAAVISALVDEIRETLAWRGGHSNADAELESFTSVTAAARAHRRRMDALETRSAST